jgi:hypothetical protein
MIHVHSYSFQKYVEMSLAEAAIHLTSKIKTLELSFHSLILSYVKLI